MPGGVLAAPPVDVEAPIASSNVVPIEPSFILSISEVLRVGALYTRDTRCDTT